MGILDNFSVQRFLDNLQYVWKGMLCIFVVIGVIILFITLLTRIMNALKTKKGKRKTVVTNNEE